MTTGILLVAAVLLLMGSVVGSSQAALTYFSETYKARILIYDIGVTLVENERDISWRDYTGADDKWDENTGVLLEYMLETEEQKAAREAAEAKGEKVDTPDLILGKKYKEELTVRNSGNIDQYVRVMVYRYWTDDKGNKLTDLSPSLIELNFLTDSGWIIDEAASTPERTVLYYTKMLKVEETAPLFNDTISIDPSVGKNVTQTVNADGNVITTTYNYDGLEFVLEAEVDAVQTHNVEDAIKSAWGVDVTLEEDGTLTYR
ncbi:MAG: hypothetical protein J6I64_01425 [Lachnospiraceae bacterium]|nr:hypothetical protein [Lachnospiraceae bacterium]